MEGWRERQGRMQGNECGDIAREDARQRVWGYRVSGNAIEYQRVSGNAIEYEYATICTHLCLHTHDTPHTTHTVECGRLDIFCEARHRPTMGLGFGFGV